MPNVLVVGSTKKRAGNVTSLEWTTDIPHIGDYDVVIFNTSALKEKQVSDLEDTFSQIKEDLQHALFSETMLITITSPLIFTQSKSGAALTNLSWFLFPLRFEAKKGKNFKVGQRYTKTFREYFSQVSNWNHLLKNTYEEKYIPEFGDDFHIKKNDLLNTKSNQALGFSIRILEYGRNMAKESNLCIFLPPTTKCSIDDGIDILIRNFTESTSKKKDLPEWTQKILLPNEKEKLVKIHMLSEKIEELKIEQELTSSELIETQEFKHLLTDKDDNLEQIVKKALKYIGINVLPAQNSDEDGVIIDPKTKDQIPIEIGGMNKGVTADKLRQLIDWSEAFEQKHIRNKGLLIINPFLKKELNSKLEGRGKLIEENIIDKATPWDLGIVTTIELFKAVVAKMNQNKIDDFIQALFNTKGKIDFNSTHASPPTYSSAD